MQLSDLPAKFDIPFASSAGVGFRRAIPKASQIGIQGGAASLTDGFPPLNFLQIAAGGIPPWGADMNGLLYQATLWLRWAAAGGIPVKYDSTFGTTIGGYPLGALLQATSFTNQGRFWISSADNNTGNPDSGASNWIPFPDVNVQLQTPNYAEDTGITNQVRIALTRVPASFAELVGAPIRFKVANANAITNPTIDINGTGQKVIINPDGSALAIGQLVAGGIAEGIPRDDDKFQLNFPTKGSTPGASWPIPGVVMPWFNETPPSGFLELNGATLLISSYPNLYPILLTRYGGDGINTFKLPDLRGEFIRGWDHGRGLDPDAATRSNAGGGITGDHVGTLQAPAVKATDITGSFELDNPILYHQAQNGNTAPYDTNDPFILGSYTYDGSINPLDIRGFAMGSTRSPLGVTPASFPVYSIRGDAKFNSSGGHETRPVNIYAMWVMAY